MNDYQKTEQKLRRLKADPVGSKYAEEIDTCLHEMFTEHDVSVETLATRLNLSGSQLRRITQVYFGMAPNQYIMHYRLRESVRILKADPRTKLSTLAEQCGFFDHAHFSHAFLRYFGQTPRQYARGKREKLVQNVQKACV